MGKSPTIEELKTRPCTLEELQAALVQTIELHNRLEADINKMISSGQIRSREEAIWNQPMTI